MLPLAEPSRCNGTMKAGYPSRRGSTGALLRREQIQAHSTKHYSTWRLYRLFILMFACAIAVRTLWGHVLAGPPNVKGKDFDWDLVREYLSCVIIIVETQVWGERGKYVCDQLAQTQGLDAKSGPAHACAQISTLGYSLMWCNLFIMLMEIGFNFLSFQLLYIYSLWLQLGGEIDGKWFLAGCPYAAHKHRSYL